MFIVYPHRTRPASYHRPRTTFDVHYRQAAAHIVPTAGGVGNTGSVGCPGYVGCLVPAQKETGAVSVHDSYFTRVPGQALAVDAL